MLQIPTIGAQNLTQSSSSAVGYDLRSTEAVTIEPSKRALVSTGVFTAIPIGHEIQIRPRSGLAAKHGITVLNSPGTIDPDYRGEIKVILINLGDQPFEINPGDRIAQAVVASVTPAVFVEVESLPETERGAGGFGSTGR